MAKLNVVHHMNELKKVLSYSKNIGFFFGAGTSCAFGLPDISRLTIEVCEKLTSKDKEIFNNACKSIEDLNGGTTATIEDILNYLRQIRDLTKSRPDLEYNGISGSDAMILDKNICKEIYNNIRKKENEADILYLRKFFAWYDSFTSGFIKEIFITNYDMLLEMAMESNYIPYFDGFTGSYEPFFNPESIEKFPGSNDSTGRWIRLWKIHGSLNWMLKEATNKSSERIVRAGNISELSNEMMIYPSKEKYSLSRKEPFIAYFDRLKQYMDNGELLFIFSGYSFSDQHINDLIFGALRQNPRMYIVVTCFSDCQIDSMVEFAASHLNLCVLGPSKVIANGSVFDWEYNIDGEDNQGWEQYWDDNNGKMILGDFKNLISFLVDNSARKSIIEEIANGK